MLLIFNGNASMASPFNIMPPVMLMIKHLYYIKKNIFVLSSLKKKLVIYLYFLNMKGSKKDIW